MLEVSLFGIVLLGLIPITLVGWIIRNCIFTTR